MNMIGFRNIAVRDYQALEIDILEAILEKHVDDFKDFTKVILKLENNQAWLFFTYKSFFPKS